MYDCPERQEIRLFVSQMLTQIRADVLGKIISTISLSSFCLPTRQLAKHHNKREQDDFWVCQTECASGK